MTTTRQATAADIQGILDLQKLYLVSNMAEEDKKDGFVTTPMSEEQIEEAMDQNGVFVGEDNGKVIAYLFACDWDYFGQWEIFLHMISRFPALDFKGHNITTQNSFQYGPVCIHKPYRGQGFLEQIFETMRLVVEPKYTFALTFINAANKRSMRAHLGKLKYQICDEWEYNGNTYYSLAYDVRFDLES